MANSNGKIGEAYVELIARIEKLEQGLDTAKVRVERDTRDMGDTAEKNVGGAFERIGTKIEGSTAGVRKLSGAISSTVGVATSLIGVFATIGSLVAIAARSAKRFADETERQSKLAPEVQKALDESAKNLKDIRQESEAEAGLRAKIRELDEQILDARKGIRSTDEYLAASAAKALRLYEQQRAEAKEQLGVLRDRLNAETLLTQEREAQAEAAAKAAAEAEKAAAQTAAQAAAIRSQIDAIATSLLSPADQVEERYAAMYAAINELAGQFSEDELARFDALIQERKARELRAIAETDAARKKADDERAEREKAADAERERRAAESAQKQADALASALTGAYERIASQQRVNDARLLGSLASIQRLLEQTRFQGQHGRSG